MNLFNLFSGLKNSFFIKKKNYLQKFLKIKTLNFFQSLLYETEIKIYLFLILKKFHLINNKNFKKPIFLFDIRNSPLTFDFADELFLANIWLNKFGFKECECIICAIREDYSPMKFKSYNLLFTKDELLQRIENILIPLANSANFITETKVVLDQLNLNKILKQSFIVFPPHYWHFKNSNLVLTGLPLYRQKKFIRNKKIHFPFVNFLEPNLFSIKALKEVLKISDSDQIVTFTIRDYEFESIRNTNYKFVIDLYTFFKSKGYRFIVVPDHKNPSPNIDAEIYSDATVDTKKRIALYNLAKINIGTAGGPIWLAKYMPGVNMFLTNVALSGNHIGSYSNLKKCYGKEFKFGRQPFLEFDLHLIYGPEDNINKLVSNKRLLQIMRINQTI